MTRASTSLLVLYSRAGCHLCDDLAAALRALGVGFEEIDVDADSRLATRYGARVPVLARRDGTELGHGRIGTDELRTRLGLE